jgi:hypothetical protein
MTQIDFYYHSKDLYQFMVYQRYRQGFKSRGVDCRFFPDTILNRNSRADMFVVQERFVGKNPETLGRPIIVEERQDSAMPLARSLIGVKNVIRFFKPGVVIPKYLNVRAERVHLWLFDREAEEASSPWQRPLTAREMKKLAPGIHFGLLDRLEPWVSRARNPNPDKWSARPIDVLFVGSTSYHVPALDRHRLRFCEALRAIHGLNIVCVPQRSMRGSDYMEMAFQSKIVVSPWGYGELCYRDTEAMLAECILIKPDTDFVRTLGNVLTSGDTYLACAIDASDLEEKIHTALNNEMWHSSETRARIRDRILEWWDEDRLVNWWFQDISACLAGQPAS